MDSDFSRAERFRFESNYTNEWFEAGDPSYDNFRVFRKVFFGKLNNFYGFMEDLIGN